MTETVRKISLVNVREVRQEHTVEFNNKRYVVINAEGVFHLDECHSEWDHGDYVGYHVSKYGTVLYTPIHSSMTYDDIEGATHAVDDGTHWHFYHGWKSEHQDFLLQLDAVIVGLFQPTIDSAMSKIVMATRPAVKTIAETKYKSLIKYRNDILDEAAKASKKIHMGYYGKNKHSDEGHLHAHIREAVAAVKLDWATNNQTDWRNVSAFATALGNTLANPHVPLTAHQIAEAKKKAKEAETSTETTSSGD